MNIAAKIENTDEFDLLRNGGWISRCDEFGSKNFLDNFQRPIKSDNGKNYVDLSIEQVAREGENWPWVSLDVSILKSRLPALIDPGAAIELTYACAEEYDLIVRLNVVDKETGEENTYASLIAASPEFNNITLGINEFKKPSGNTIKPTEEIVSIGFFVCFPPEGGSSYIKIDRLVLKGFAYPDNNVDQYYDAMDKTIMAVERSIAHFLHDFIIQNNIKRTLEVGLGEGLSAMSMMLATGENHTAIDPLTFTTVGAENMKKMGLDSRLRILKQYSQFALPKLCEANETFQFTFIDGSGKLDDYINDFRYVSSMTEIGGYIIIPDNEKPSMPAFRRYIETNRKDFISIKTPAFSYLSLWKKVAEDERQWDHHVAFEG